VRRTRSGKSAPVGFIGLGLMGGPMARHLARRGVPLLVHDLNPRAVQAVVDGARAAASPKAIASAAGLVFTCLPSLNALQEVALGKRGLSAGRAIRTYVNLSSTGSPFAREMAAALKSYGITMLDSPIIGGESRTQPSTDSSRSWSRARARRSVTPSRS
jgi:3-hydroxyisobutyrate dehydrogenase-like beta-hydroxyacid dehydrogenase